MAMNEQHEDPAAAAHIAIWKAMTPQANEPGAFVGGARILNFTKGWASNIASPGGRAHWFVLGCDVSEDVAKALCGALAWEVHMHGPGNYPKCSGCIRKMSAMIKRGENP